MLFFLTVVIIVVESIIETALSCLLSRGELSMIFIDFDSLGSALATLKFILLLI